MAFEQLEDDQRLCAQIKQIQSKVIRSYLEFIS
jgi:hypothetical protein